MASDALRTARIDAIERAASIIFNDVGNDRRLIRDIRLPSEREVGALTAALFSVLRAPLREAA